MLLGCSSSSSDMDALVRRVTERGREDKELAERRVRRHFDDSVRAWATVSALSPKLRGALVEVNGMQVGARVCPCSLTSSLFVTCDRLHFCWQTPPRGL